MIRVSVCDDSEWFAALVTAWTEQHEDLEFVGSADERASALAKLAAARPDVVLLDTMTYGMEPIAVEDVRTAVPGVRVLLCSGYTEAFAGELVGEADAYVGKDEGETRLVDAIRRVAG